MENKEVNTSEEVFVDNPLNKVPLEHRQHWITPAVIFGGLEFTIPVLMGGSILIGSYGIKAMFPVLFVAFILIQWPGNFLAGYIGAKTGRASSIVARTSFGKKQARFIIALVIFLVSMGWWAVQTAVAGNAICAMLNIDYANNWGTWAIITIIAGLIFAIPSIIGYASMKWTDYIAVPAGLILVLAALYLSIRNFGIDTIMSFQPVSKELTFGAAVSVIVGLNVSQWVISMDYTRMAKPKVRDNILIPLGIIGIGFPLVYVGAVMAIGEGTADIVQVMMGLGFPVWGFLVLWLSTWTSQLVNNYSMGLSFSSLLNVGSDKGRAILTFIGTLIAIAVALSGILDHFMDFLYFTALLYPPIAGVMFADFFMRDQEWEDHEGWNWIATIAMASGSFSGYIITYVKPMGIPAVISLIIAGIVYYIGMKIKANVAPDQFTPESLKN